MSRTYKDNQKGSGRRRRQHQASVRAVRRDQPDLRKLARAVIQLALAEAEAEAAADQQTRSLKNRDDAEDAEADRA